ncbi:SMI1/KNR4 family protein [Cohnella rhizosphaerae]|uniref:SMI1/KNR4 family protein n=1 Tax=Cohnella rhizosphaerae TaxID=1457232 RepID=A0A9X4QX56_9BACL|nr:SMI1/KNR4 family protein [Cohnella rhizosphaerae]MDG0813087.1 SMI1/KNR4 family protein [Cohnella rhizosphaerae]
MEAVKLTDTYTVDNCGRKEFYGTYYSSEVLSEGKDGQAPKLVQNHGASDEEIRNMEQWLKSLRYIVHGGDISVGCTEEQIEAAEGRLGVSLPAELRTFYRIAGNDPLLTTDGNSKKKDRYLPLDELHVSDGNIVYRMRKKELFALSTDRRQIMFMDDGAWYWEPHMESFCENVMITAAIFAISHLKHSAKGRLKGKLVSSLQARKLAEQQFSDFFRALDTYYHPFCALFL